MIAVNVRNVNEALPEACHQMRLHGRTRDTRNGRALVCRGVFATEYQEPTQRVLFEPLRDCNPFFHLMEAMWMLAGRNDVAWISRFNSQIEEYSDDGISFSGAYGFRWRRWYTHDQIRWIADRLHKNPDDRRCVLAMWDGRLDPSIADRDGKDVPCNLSASLHINDNHLDMCVFNRSNDLIWGSYGANVVHFSILQEYLAAAIRCKVGTYSQVSANTHVYERHWPLMEQLAGKARHFREDMVLDPYTTADTWVMPLLAIGSETVEMFDSDCQMLVTDQSSFVTRFFQLVVGPMREAYDLFSQRENPNRIDLALSAVAGMPNFLDWRVSCEEWLGRRVR